MINMIEDDMKNLMYDCYDKLIDKLPDSLKLKFQNLFFDKNKFDIKDGISQVTGPLGIFISSLFLNYTAIFILRTFATEATLSFISGPPGWIIGGVFSVGYIAYYSLKNIFWKKEDCFDDMVDSFYNYTNKNLDKIIDISCNNYEKVVTKFRDILTNLKQILEKMPILYEILKRYDYGETRFNDPEEALEEVFKKAFNEFEENFEIKMILIKLFLENN